MSASGRTRSIPMPAGSIAKIGRTERFMKATSSQSIQQLCLPMSFSAQGFPVSRSPWLEEGKPNRMKGGSGPKLCESFAYLDRAISSWKTFQVCLAPEWEIFSGIWPMAGMTRSGIAYRRLPLVPHISGTEFSLWATPSAADVQGSQLWPTPCGPNNGGTNGKRKLKAMLWPTPRSSPNENRQTKRTPSQSSGSHGLTLAAEVGGQLNPPFVEWLMGFPLGWTDLSALATRSSRRSLSGSGTGSKESRQKAKSPK